MQEIPLSRLVPVSECVAKCDSERLSLTGYGYVRTPDIFAVPLRIEAVAKTDSTNLRLHFAKGHIILNWEVALEQMACYEPVYGHTFFVKGQGKVPLDTWVRVTWEIQENFMRVLVDGELRYSNEGEVEAEDEFQRNDYSGLIGPACIGPGWGSTVTVKSLKVEELA